MASRLDLSGATNSDDIERLESSSEALKWILVTYFGHYCYRNSKFGRIEAHEAINGYAREIMLTGKEHFESKCWCVIHGIVDSISVEAVEGEAQTDVEAIAHGISEALNIRLEYEAEYDWSCFVPRRDADTGGLTKYFGKKSGEDAYKVRGFEIRQRSTPALIARAQREFMDALDRHRSPGAVIVDVTPVTEHSGTGRRS